MPIDPDLTATYVIVAFAAAIHCVIWLVPGLAKRAVTAKTERIVANARPDTYPGNNPGAS